MAKAKRTRRRSTKHGEVITGTNPVGDSVTGADAEGELGSVEVGGGLTKKVGEFDFVKVHVNVVVPCGTSDDEYDKAKDRASALVDKYLDDEYDKAIQGVED